MEPIVDPEVASALRRSNPVVGLESTITSTLGLPPPTNAESLARNLSAIREAGAVPAVTAVLDGEIRVGVDAAAHDRLLGDATKVAARDLGVVVARQVRFGATTVSASLRLCGHVGIEVFATGGIGGVHHGASTTGDRSADLGAIASVPAITVCAGAKAFLDLAATLEDLDTRSVPVIGYGTDEFPMFTSVSSGLPVPHRLDSVDEIARAFDAHRQLGGGGMLVAVPVPEGRGVDLAVMNAAREQALADLAERRLTGADVTPFLLERIADLTGGESVSANLALAENNARVAAHIAIALSRLR